MTRQCDICGRECDERDMVKISPSPAHPLYRCWFCYKKGQREMHSAEIVRGNRINKVMKTRR